MHAQELIKHTARLRWVDREGREHAERHVGWTAQEATRLAWRRARSMRLSGEAAAFRIEHHERVTAESCVIEPANDDFALPEFGGAA
ncbi:hypothetical protein [Phenylobacterium sp.]|uniref:hypothetical protein n=1 Tax=Phenylobacterium sp. TaxID=1871053 RepID=UPI002810EF2B|nr:hypothetical protein [Phenylobacterium sp.]